MTASQESIREILFHELLHMARRCMNHGVLWKTYAEACDLADHGHPERSLGPIKASVLDSTLATPAYEKYFSKSVLYYRRQDKWGSSDIIRPKSHDKWVRFSTYLLVIPENPGFYHE